MAENRVQCWLCRKWVLERHSIEENFLNKPERVCIVCAEALHSMDGQLDVKLDAQKVMEDAKRDFGAAAGEHPGGETGVGEAPTEAENPG